MADKLAEGFFRNFFRATRNRFYLVEGILLIKSCYFFMVINIKRWSKSTQKPESNSSPAKGFYRRVSSRIFLKPINEPNIPNILTHLINSTLNKYLKKIMASKSQTKLSLNKVTALCPERRMIWGMLLILLKKIKISKKILFRKSIRLHQLVMGKGQESRADGGHAKKISTWRI